MKYLFLNDLIQLRHHHHLEILVVVAVAVVVVVVAKPVSGLGLSAWSRADSLIFPVHPHEF